jgi:hypothetical protein
MLVGLFLAVGGIGVVSSQRAQKEDVSEKATPIRRGIMTARQREHSKLFSGRSIDSKKLTDSGNKELTLTVGLEEGSFSSEERPTINELIRDLTCESDAIVVGIPTSKQSQLTPEEDFIFTDFNIAVATVLKDDSRRSIRGVNDIIVSRAGGKVSFDGHTITVVDRSATRLLSGTSYLLFLKRVPKTGAYTTLRGSSSILDNGETQKLTEQNRGEIPSGTSFSKVADLINLYANEQCEAYH